MPTHRPVASSAIVRIAAALLLLATALATATPAAAAPADGLVITGVVDGPLTGGVPKAIELYVVADVADLSAWGLGSANNGGGTDGQEFTFPAVAADAGTFLYVASEVQGFADFFGFAPDHTSSAASINGDDAIELFRDGVVVDVFGDVDVDGSQQPWEYLDGWAHRVDGTGRDGTTFALGNWTFSGANALDGAATNDGAATPFPVRSWSPDGDGGGGGGDDGPVAAFVHEVQGDGPQVVPGTYVVEAVVTSLFEDGGEVEGFFVQEEDDDADADPATSEGLFVFCGGCPTAVAEGDLVRVTGDATDFFGMSQLVATADGAVQVVSSGNAAPTPSTVELPVSAPDLDAFYEAREGMLVTFAGTTVVSEYFQLARFGEVRLFGDARPYQYTQLDDTPTAEEYAAHLDALARNVVRLDDDNDQNSPLPDGVVYHPRPGGFSVGAQGADFFRGGDTVTDLTGVLHWSFAGARGTDAWRVRPTTTAPVAFTPLNIRPAGPADVGGPLRVASFNVLNYFATLDLPGTTCGPSALECRGADSEAERVRQLDKIVAALDALDADVVGLIELENDADDEAVGQVVAALNAVSDRSYAAIETGSIGTDAIKVALVHDTATTTATGPFAVLDASVDPRFVDDRNRPILAQTFTEVASGEAVTVSVAHLKSKGSPCDDLGDPTDPAGAGNCNLTRTAAVEAYLDWVGSDPTGTGDQDHLLVGDLNSYAGEDPIAVLTDAGWVDLAERYVGPDRYGYVFDGQLGTLDYVFANPSADEQSTGATEWHVNADEAPLFDYDDTVVDPTEASFEAKPSGNPLYEPNAYRSSDHDPALAGFELRPPTCNGLPATIVGTVAGEELVGTDGPDVIAALAGDDTVLGLDGDDVVCGGDGDDTIDGGNGDDLLDGGDGDDELLGRNGADELHGGADDDALLGGNGPDLLDGGEGTDTGDGGRGPDTCISIEGATSCRRRQGMALVM